ncbi:NLR family, CARD domain containing 3 [Seminavis robusta]|uniref:NLR family, CARD domain containing 3 n=1 Tax=Seminavis robusta TaxID=568900 RepID=A0A9N8ERD0_9STRA|nr:NLR family, CARD domain containing 3 [Seminavis robusta]|eukprot:Sro1866_g302540.1 NLR family, CARD domain containing 3 (297) ;mRNA; r:17014-17904
MTLSSSSSAIHPDALKGLITLREAGVFHNKLSVDIDNQHCADAWSPLVQCDDETGLVVALDLGGCRLRKGIPHGDGVPEVLSSVQTLNLGGTDLPISAEVIILKELVLLETLHLGGNGLRDAGTTVVAQEYLPTALSLKCLDLRYNDIRPEGCQALCQGLATLLQKDTDTGLVKLFLEGNSITDQGAVALAQWLKLDGNPLQELFLGSNSIGPDGATALAEALQTNKTISKIFLEGNRIGPVGADAFTKVLTECKGETAVKHLYCDNNDIGKEASKRLAKALNSATTVGDSLLEEE